MNIQTTYGKPIINQHFGRKTTQTPVELAQEYQGFPVGTKLGWIQSSVWRSGHVECFTSGDNGAVIGHDVQWLVTQFLENQCGGKQRRLNQIKPGVKFVVARFFGYLPHADCIYNTGIELRIKAASNSEVVTTRTTKGSRLVKWKRDIFENLVLQRNLVPA